MRCISKAFRALVDRLPVLKEVDFTPLLKKRKYNPDQVEIDRELVVQCTAMAVHYGLNTGLAVRICGEEPMGKWKDVDKILGIAAQEASDDDLDQMRRILTVGCPAKFKWEEPNRNKQNYIRYGNEPSIQENIEPVTETLNKEEKNDNIIPFEWWIVIFSAFAHVVP